MNKSDLDFWKNRVSELEQECAEKQKQISELEIKYNMKKTGLFTNEEKAFYEAKIKALEEKLLVVENLLKNNNGLDGENKNNQQLPIEPIDVASMLINARVEYETNSLQRAFGVGEKALADKYSDDDLRQIAEHLFIYCNHNSEETEQ